MTPNKYGNEDLRMIAAELRAADAAAGVVRVDTRNPATRARIASAIVGHVLAPKVNVIAPDCCVDAVLAALTEEQP